MSRLSQTASGQLQVAIPFVIIVAVASIAVFVLLNHHHSGTSQGQQATNLSSYCVGQTLARGDTGRCVKDAQVLIDYMDTHFNELPSCNFLDSGVAYNVTVNGDYDATNVDAVQRIQSWARCYAKQEGFATNVKTDGIIDKPTWGELCIYGYTDPLHSGVGGTGAAISAGKDAGCAQLQP